MLARTPWRLMIEHERLITDDMAYSASLRHWGRHDAQRLAKAVVWGIYPEAEAKRELAATLAWHAEQARIRAVSCRTLAASMLEDEREALEVTYDKVLADMARAAELVLRSDPRAKLGAACAAADIARANEVPPRLIDAAFHFAIWRTRRRA